MIIHPALIAGLSAMIIAQIIKFPIHRAIHKEWFPMIVFSTGGMPSSHSAFVTALTSIIALEYGVNSIYFAISFTFAAIVMHDAIGIRREAGKHATVLNQIGQEIGNIFKEIKKGQDAESEKIDNELKELLGHEPLEVVFGFFLGVIVAYLVYLLFL
jgi:acid phosphatase family membrane protein YuiD